MSVVFRNENGWLIDHKRFIDDTYANCKVPRDCIVEPNRSENRVQRRVVCSDMVCPTFDKRYFDIYSQFMMDSHANKLIESSLKSSPLPQDPFSKAKRKRKLSKQTLKTPYQDEVVDSVKQSIATFIQIGYELGLFYSAPLEFTTTNNREARMAARQVYNLGEQFSKTFTNLPPSKLNVASYNESFVINDITNTVVQYNGTVPCLASICNNDFLIPPNCCFFMSDIQRLTELTELGRCYDFIVLDPPWLNKSVKRKKGYSTLTNSDIVKIPIENLSNDGCIFVVWVTNKQAHIDFVKEELFPLWKVKFRAIWHWLKVTVSGEFICNLDWHHKKPYEHLIIGQKLKEDTKTGTQFQNHKIIYSVPSSIHSHKPPIQDIFESYLKPSSKKLELFARYLLPGWTSWGNEVLLLQHLNHFKNS